MEGMEIKSSGSKFLHLIKEDLYRDIENLRIEKLHA